MPESSSAIPRGRLRLLLVEDSPADAELILRAVRDGGIEVDPVRIETEAELQTALQSPPDLILADYLLPRFGGLQALRLAHRHEPDVPVIMVSGSIGEDHAAECLREGAVDYVLKDRLGRLPHAITRALERRALLGRQRQAEEERILLRTMINQIPDAIYVKDLESRFVLANEAMAKLAGVADPAGLMGKTDADFFPEAEARRFREEEKEVFAGEPKINQEDSFLGTEGKTQILLTTKLPLRDSAGRITGLVGIGREITERKRLEDELLRAQRMESVGRLASGIAHDMNNILAPILMGAPLLRMPHKPADVDRTLTTIEGSARRGAELVKQLLVFGRGGEGRRAGVELGALAEELVGIARQTFPKNIGVRLDMVPGARTVYGDATQLHQVLLNLCVNARDAMAEGGVLTLAIANEEIDAEAAGAHPEVRPGPFVRLTVSDTGSGIPPEILDRIFEPFFSTKEQGKGTGLGLATVAAVVKSHGGFLGVQTAVGQGTSFHIHLPADPAARDVMAAEQAAPPAEGQGETILVVDDEESIRNILRDLLERHHYQVLTAADGAEATSVFARHPNTRLVLTDLDMPFVDGVMLVRLLRNLRPGLRIIVSSGVMDHALAARRLAELNELGVTKFLGKPTTLTQMLQAIREELERPEAG